MRAPLPGTVGLRILVACCFFITIAGAQNVSMGSTHGSVVKLRDKLMTGALSEGCDGLPLALAAVRSDIGRA